MNGLFREINSSLLIGQITWLVVGVLKSPMLTNYELLIIRNSDSSSSLKYLIIEIVIEIDF